MASERGLELERPRASQRAGLDGEKGREAAGPRIAAVEPAPQIRLGARAEHAVVRQLGHRLAGELAQTLARLRQERGRALELRHARALAAGVEALQDAVHEIAAVERGELRLDVLLHVDAEQEREQELHRAVTKGIDARGEDERSPAQDLLRGVGSGRVAQHAVEVADLQAACGRARLPRLAVAPPREWRRQDSAAAGRPPSRARRQRSPTRSSATGTEMRVSSAAPGAAPAVISIDGSSSRNPSRRGCVSITRALVSPTSVAS
ncbi:MAG: hypothetical protein U1E76_09535 [Planctomycetota bacterium]